MAKLKLSRGTAVRRSVRGAKDFFYPDMKNSCVMLRENCTAERQAGWNDCGQWRAVVVPTSAMSEKDRYDNHTTQMVVWVKNNG